MKILLLSLLLANSMHAKLTALPEYLQANSMHAKLAALPEHFQTSVLGEIATQVGYSCVGARSMFQGLGPDGTAWWSIQCSNGNRYSVEVGKDIRVRLCSVSKQVALVDCFVRF